MSLKRSKKSLKPLAPHLLLGIPTNIAAGPLGFRAELDVNPEGEEGYPRITIWEQIELIWLRR